MANAFPIRFEPTLEQIRADIVLRACAREAGWDYTEFPRDTTTWATFIREKGSVTNAVHPEGGYMLLIPRDYARGAAVTSKEVVSGA